MIRRVRRWLLTVGNYDAERDEVEAQRFWLKRFSDHPEELLPSNAPARSPEVEPTEGQRLHDRARPDKTQIGSREGSTVGEGEALLVGLFSILLYVPGACLLGYGLGPGKSAWLILSGALMIAVGLPLRILGMRWRHKAPSQSGSSGPSRGD